MFRRNPVFNVTSITATNKSVAINSLKRAKFSTSVLANLDEQVNILLNEESTEEQKVNAVKLLTDDKTVLYTHVSRDNCKELCKKLNKLNFLDFLKPPYYKKGANGEKVYCFINNKKIVNGEVLFRTAVPVTSYMIKNGTKVEFIIKWTYVIPPKYEEPSEIEPTPEPTVTHNVVVTNNASAIVTNVEPSSGEVEDGNSFTATLTFAEEKSADDITVTGATVSGNTLTVSNVTDDVNVVISVKE